MIALQVVIFVRSPLPPEYRPADPALEWCHPVRQETSMRLCSLVRRSSASSMVIWDLPDGLAQRDPVGDRGASTATAPPVSTSCAPPSGASSA